MRPPHESSRLEGWWASTLLVPTTGKRAKRSRLGHSPITTTLDLYSHVTDTIQTDAAAQLDAALRVALKGPTAGE